jgi:hypothetical protein
MFLVRSHSSQMVRWWVLVHSGQDQGTKQVIGPCVITPLLGLPPGRILCCAVTPKLSWVVVGTSWAPSSCKAWYKVGTTTLTMVLYFNFELIFLIYKTLQFIAS